MRLLKITATALGMIVLALGTATAGLAEVIRKGDQIFLVDRRGEHWDITQAVSIGFEPRGFRHGIGRNAIRPLDESSLESMPNHLDDKIRVIGVENGADAHAYVVRKLSLHEIANTRLADTPIAAAY